GERVARRGRSDAARAPRRRRRRRDRHTAPALGRAGDGGGGATRRGHAGRRSARRLRRHAPRRGQGPAPDRVRRIVAAQRVQQGTDACATPRAGGDVNPWLILVMASAFEVVMALGLKWSDGFSRLGGSAVAIGGAVVSMWLLAIALRS